MKSIFLDLLNKNSTEIKTALETLLPLDQSTREAKIDELRSTKSISSFTARELYKRFGFIEG